MNDENGVKHCASCGAEISGYGLYCDNCKELKELDRSTKLAKIFTILLFVNYFGLLFLFIFLENLGSRLSSGTDNELPIYVFWLEL